MPVEVIVAIVGSVVIKFGTKFKFLTGFFDHGIEWIYKNGDKGSEYFSLVYQDNSGKQKTFYPDYLISVNGEIWIIETKGGFDRSGNSQDIDLYTHKKSDVLKSIFR